MEKSTFVVLVGKSETPFHVPVDFRHICNLLIDTSALCIELPGIEPEGFRKYITFVNLFYDSERHQYILPSKWNHEKLTHLSMPGCFELVMVASYLDCTIVYDLLCCKIATYIKAPVSSKELFETFDFSKEEVEKIRKENAWCFSL